MKDWQLELQRQWHEACNLAGIKKTSDDKYCQLLAWVSIYGAGNEAVVMNTALSGAILAAQKRLNIFGGEVPDQKLVPVMLSYLDSIKDFDNPPEWVPELEKEYGVKSYRSNK